MGGGGGGGGDEVLPTFVYKVQRESWSTIFPLVDASLTSFCQYFTVAGLRKSGKAVYPGHTLPMNMSLLESYIIACQFKKR